MWPSWVFGPGFLTPPAQLPARCPIRALLEQEKRDAFYKLFSRHFVSLREQKPE